MEGLDGAVKYGMVWYNLLPIALDGEREERVARWRSDGHLLYACPFRHVTLFYAQGPITSGHSSSDINGCLRTIAGRKRRADTRRIVWQPFVGDSLLHYAFVVDGARSLELDAV